MSRPVLLPVSWTPVEVAAARRVWASALCAQTDPELFFPERGEGGASRAARRVCQRCEVRAECLELFGPLVADGVVGGLTAAERRALRATGGLPRSA